MAASQTAAREIIKLPPSGMSVALKAQFRHGVSVFLWGPPGVAKSSLARQVATSLGIAFVDLRLSQIEPTDILGIPYPVTEGGVSGVKWSPPLTLPRDLDLTLFRDCEAIDNTIGFYNPQGKNGIYYCTDASVEVRSVTPGTIAQVVVLDAQGEPVPVGSKVRLQAPQGALYGNVAVEEHPSTLTAVEPAGSDGYRVIRSRRLDQVTVVLYRLVDGEMTNEMVSGRVRLQARGQTRAILGLEEFNSAAQSVQTAAYSLVLDRYVGDYHVPDGVSIVAMGNRDTDKGITYRMATPIANRFCHLHMDTDVGTFFRDWQQWAIENLVSPEVIAYLNAFKEDLFRFDPTSNNHSFPTPRSWEMVSKIIAGSDELTPHVERAKVVGAVGSGVAFKFLQFRRIAAQLPDAMDVLEGRVKKIGRLPELRPAVDATAQDLEAIDDLKGEMVTFEDGAKLERHGIALQVALATALCHELRTRFVPIARKHGAGFGKTADFAEWGKLADNFLDFLMDDGNFQKEVAIMAVRAAIQTYRMPFDTKNMKKMREFATANSSAIVW